MSISYELKARLRKANCSGRSVWSHWTKELHFATATETATILGYDNDTVYIANNEWNLVLDTNLGYKPPPSTAIDEHDDDYCKS